jgi:ABC-type Co2+ transport system permease subunit
VSHTRLLFSAIAAWIAIVLVALFARVALPSPAFSFNESLVWLFVGIAPAAILFSVIRSTASTPIAQVLYDAENPADAKIRARDGRQ